MMDQFTHRDVYRVIFSPHRCHSRVITKKTNEKTAQITFCSVSNSFH